jgi:hypothetical protein
MRPTAHLTIFETLTCDSVTPGIEHDFTMGV